MNSNETTIQPTISISLPGCDWADVQKIIDEYVDANNQVNDQARRAIADMQKTIDARLEQNELYLDIKRRIIEAVDKHKAALVEEFVKEDQLIQGVTDGQRNSDQPQTARRRSELLSKKRVLRGRKAKG